jgi:hypothetical protein
MTRLALMPTAQIISWNSTRSGRPPCFPITPRITAYPPPPLDRLNTGIVFRDL